MNPARLAVYLLLLATPLASEASVRVTVEWVAVSDPGPGRDTALSVCLWEDSVFAVGWEEQVDNATSRFVARVEARRVRDGSLRAARRLDPGGHSWLASCAVKDGVLFVVGGRSTEDESETRLYVASLRVDDLSVISSALSEPNASGVSLYVHGDHVYVLGTLYGKGGDVMWLVEKRRADDLGLVKSFVYDPFPGITVTDSPPVA